MTAVQNEPTKPEWPLNVMVFKPEDGAEDIKKRILPTQDPTKEFDVLYSTPENKFANLNTGNKAITYTSENHFSTKHYALLFAPGDYKDCRFEVGYYVQMAGLGKSPEEVNFIGEQSGPFVEALNKDMKVTNGGSIAQNNAGLCLDTFWRAAENFASEKTQWAVSQAAPLRNVVVKKQLMCGDGAAYSSGGFLANAQVYDDISYAANQQWFTRAVDFAKVTPTTGAWSTVFSGCTGNVPEGQTLKGEHVISVEENPEVRVEKPFIAMKMVEGEEYYELVVPSSTKDHVSGPNVSGKYGDVRSFARVKVCKPILPLNEKKEYIDHDDTTYNDITVEDEKITNELQAALDEGKDLVLCPGIFFLTKTLTLKHKNQVVLGLGLATLIAPQDGSPCIRVEPNVAGVRIGGITLEASLQQKKGIMSKLSRKSTANVDGVRSLIEVGVPGVEDAGDAHNPVLLADIFTRVGGSNLVREGVETDAMVRIHSGNVVGDNLWLWRADHVKLGKTEKPNDPNFPYYHQTRTWETDEKGNKVKKVNECFVKNALVVNGDNVQMFGLFCEHTVEHQMVWNGENGTVNFFQCELPYDVDVDFAEDGFVGYYVDDKVKTHMGRGIGVYCNFQVFDVHAPLGAKVPASASIESPFTRFLQNHGGIKNVIQVGEEKIGDAVTDDSRHSNGWVGLQE